MSILRPTANPVAMMRAAREAAKTAEERHSAVLAHIDSLADLLHADVKEMGNAMTADIAARFEAIESAQRDMAKEMRALGTIVGDLNNTLKEVLPSLKTQQAARPTSRAEMGRQGS